MIEDLLQLNGLSIGILEQLSYHSQLGKSLKQNLHYFDRETLLSELSKVTEWLAEQTVLEEIALDFRIKSTDSIELKYERYYPNRQVRQVFNDILGFRAFCDDYNELIALDSTRFRIVDMSKGKSIDDGYRGVHLYFQKDNFHYPIEVQFNTLYDRQLNNWLHSYLYKKNYPDMVGREMRIRYEKGMIRSKEEFEEVLRDVLCDSQGYK
jgi:putative GTP pyrophosphokinase